MAFLDKNGKKEIRSTGINCTKGLILYFNPSENKDKWKIDFPKEGYTGEHKRYGGVDLAKVISVLTLLDNGKTIEDVDKKVFKDY